MGITILSAAMVAIDIAFFVIIGLFLLAGYIRGISKTFSGFLSFVVIMLIAIILVGLTIAPVSQLGFVKSLDNKLAETASGWGDVFSEPITFDEEKGCYTIFDGAKLSDYDGLKGKFANWLAERFMTPENDGVNLASIASGMLTTLIIAICLFIIGCVILGFIRYGLSRLTLKMHDSTSGTVRFVDRLLGAIFSIALALIFILLILAILKSINVAAINEFINQSSICGVFYNSNPISDVFAKIFGA